MLAHGGGLNSSGCHNNHKTGDYHCHSKGSSKSGDGVNSNSSRSSGYDAGYNWAKNNNITSKSDCYGSNSTAFKKGCLDFVSE